MNVPNWVPSEGVVLTRGTVGTILELEQAWFQYAK